MRRVLQHRWIILFLLFSVLSFNSSNDYGTGGYSYKPGSNGKDILPVEDEIKRIIKEREYREETIIKDLADVKIVETVKPDIWPVVGLITSDFGWRIFRKVKEFHTGVDIAAPYGTPVNVTSSGRVIYVGWIKGYGKTVIVYHGYGFVTLYGHLLDYAVGYGEKVEKGQIIGYVGSTGRTSGPHLHYEVIKYGIRQDPILYLP